MLENLLIKDKDIFEEFYQNEIFLFSNQYKLNHLINTFHPIIIFYNLLFVTIKIKNLTFRWVLKYNSCTEKIEYHTNHTYYFSILYLLIDVITNNIYLNYK